MNQRLPHGRLIAFPAVVFLISIGISVSVFLRLHDEARAATSRQLTDAGDELIEYADELTLEAIEQVQATKALFEASREVTLAEFVLFEHTIGHKNGRGVDYAPRVTASEFDQFIADARVDFPGYRIRGADSQPISSRPGGVYWPLLYRWGSGDVFVAGFDFGSDPAIQHAIESSILLDRPAASRFGSVPGHSEHADVLIVTAIGPNATPDGIAVVTLTLDDLLTARALELVGPGITLELTQPSGGELERVADGHFHWLGQTTVGGQPLALVLDSNQPLAGSRAAPWVLAFGIGSSVLLGWVIYGRRRRNALSQFITRLETALAEKDRFLAGISHAVRTPMTAVIGALEILADPQIPLDQSTSVSLLDDARSGALELERLTENYLTAARLSSGAFTLKAYPVDLDLLVARTIAGLDIPLGLAVTVEPLGRCEADTLRVHQIVRNLGHNATQYARSAITVRSRKSADHVSIQFVNDGPAVPEHLIGSLFSPFEKEEIASQPDSIGLGLSVSRELARAMGGDLSYAYEHGQVIFELSLPAIARVNEVKRAQVNVSLGDR